HRPLEVRPRVVDVRSEPEVRDHLSLGPPIAKLARERERRLEPRPGLVRPPDALGPRAQAGERALDSEPVSDLAQPVEPLAVPRSGELELAELAQGDRQVEARPAGVAGVARRAERVEAPLEPGARLSVSALELRDRASGRLEARRERRIGRPEHCEA